MRTAIERDGWTVTIGGGAFVWRDPAFPVVCPDYLGRYARVTIGRSTVLRNPMSPVSARYVKGTVRHRAIMLRSMRLGWGP